MRLDRSNRRVLGVCAGIANWLDLPATLVRIVFIVCVIVWPPFLAAYFILYFCLDRAFSPDEMQDYFRSAETVRHFRRLDYRKPIYRNERDKKIAGVCAGIADYLEVSAFSVRVVTLISLFFFGPFTFWAYVICWFVFDRDPHVEPDARARRRQARHEAQWDRQERRRERRQQRRERRRERRAQRHARRETGRAGEDFDSSVEGVAADIGEAVDEVAQELHAEFGEVIDSFKQRSGERRRRAADTANGKQDKRRKAFSMKECTAIYSQLERRLQEIEAFMTSRKFRLYCQFNRI